MNPSITIGIDNGQSGSVAILGAPDGPLFFPVPTQDYLHYGKRGTVGKRLLRSGLALTLRLAKTWGNAYVYIERPFSGKFINAVLPAHRFYEATIIVFEDLELGYEVVDSQTWQKPVLGNVTGSANLKKASMLRGIQYYPALADVIRKHKDADGLLIAHHFHSRRNQTQ